MKDCKEPKDPACGEAATGFAEFAFPSPCAITRCRSGHRSSWAAFQTTNSAVARPNLERRSAEAKGPMSDDDLPRNGALCGFDGVIVGAAILEVTCAVETLLMFTQFGCIRGIHNYIYIYIIIYIIYIYICVTV